MIYSNNDPAAILAMEIDRLGNYNYDDYSSDGECCPICNAYEPEYYYFDMDDECIGCSDCIRKESYL